SASRRRPKCRCTARKSTKRSRRARKSRAATAAPSPPRSFSGFESGRGLPHSKTCRISRQRPELPQSSAAFAFLLSPDRAVEYNRVMKACFVFMGLFFVCIIAGAAEHGVVPLFPEDGTPKGWVVGEWNDVSKPGKGVW